MQRICVDEVVIIGKCRGARLAVLGELVVESCTLSCCEDFSTQGRDWGPIILVSCVQQRIS